MRNAIFLGGLTLLAASACQPAQEPGAPLAGETESATAAPAPADGAPTGIQSSEGAAFSAIGDEETVRFVGTEPFWGGTVTGSEMVYSTPENQDGDTIAVRRFAGNNGLGFSGTFNDAPLDMTVTPGKCSDGMSDRTYPFTVTLKLGSEQRNGCAWTNRTPFSGPANP